MAGSIALPAEHWGWAATALGAIAFAHGMRFAGVEKEAGIFYAALSGAAARAAGYLVQRSLELAPHHLLRAHLTAWRRPLTRGPYLVTASRNEWWTTQRWAAS